MHEMSIASSLLGLAVAAMPAGTRLAGLTLQVGPLQSIDPVALRWAWRAVAAGSPHAHAAVNVAALPWKLRCRRCENEFESDRLDAPCRCGAGGAYPVGGDELLLSHIDVEPIQQEARHASARD